MTDPTGLAEIVKDLHALRVAGYLVGVAFTPGEDGIVQVRAEGDGRVYAATAATPAEAMAEMRGMVPSYN